MRTILSIIALFSLVQIHAQHIEPAIGREKAGGELYIYPTEELAAQRNGAENNTYTTHIEKWEQQQNKFMAHFTMPFAWLNRRVLLHMDSGSAPYTLRVNGREIYRSTDASNVACYNITKVAKEGRNTVEVELEESSSVAQLEDWRKDNKPYPGNVRIVCPPMIHIRDVLVATHQNEGNEALGIAQIGIVVKTGALNPRSSKIHYSLLDPQGEEVVHGAQNIQLELRGEDTLYFVGHIPYEQLWTPQRPMQYTLRLKTEYNGRVLEHLDLPLGFRTLSLDAKGNMLLNNQPVELRLKEVQPSMSDAEIDAVRQEGFTIVRLLPGDVRRGLLDYCDKTGLLVIAQAPIDTHKSGLSRKKGGNPSNDPQWKDEFIARAENSFHVTKRHPSVVAFSMAYRSANGINLYETYLNMKQLGDERPVVYFEAEGEWNHDRLLVK